MSRTLALGLKCSKYESASDYKLQVILFSLVQGKFTGSLDLLALRAYVVII